MEPLVTVVATSEKNLLSALTEKVLWGVNSENWHGFETATLELWNSDKHLMSCQNSNNGMGTFRNSNIPSFEIQMEDMDNSPYRALLNWWMNAHSLPIFPANHKSRNRHHMQFFRMMLLTSWTDQYLMSCRCNTPHPPDWNNQNEMGC